MSPGRFVQNRGSRSQMLGARRVEVLATNSVPTRAREQHRFWGRLPTGALGGAAHTRPGRAGTLAHRTHTSGPCQWFRNFEIM